MPSRGSHAARGAATRLLRRRKAEKPASSDRRLSAEPKGAALFPEPWLRLHVFGFRTWRPLYMPVFRSMWCGTAQFARVLVLDIARGLERIGGAAHAAAGGGRFASRNSHRKLQQKTPVIRPRRTGREMGRRALTRKRAAAPAPTQAAACSSRRISLTPPAAPRLCQRRQSAGRPPPSRRRKVRAPYGHGAG